MFDAQSERVIDALWRAVPPDEFIGVAIGQAVADAIFDFNMDALEYDDPIALAIVDLVNSVCHCDACHNGPRRKPGVVE